MGPVAKLNVAVNRLISARERRLHDYRKRRQYLDGARIIRRGGCHADAGAQQSRGEPSTLNNHSNMISEEDLHEAVKEFTKYSLNEPREQIQRREYKIYNWTDDGRMGSTETFAVPWTRSWLEEPREDVPKIENLIENLVSDEDCPLIKSRSDATRAFNRVIRGIRIETRREGNDKLRSSSEILEDFHSDTGQIEALSPIIGLTFEKSIQIEDNLKIRRVTELEKELMLNQGNLGGGSVTISKGLEIGSVTHVAAYEVPASTEENRWVGGLARISDRGKEVHNKFDNLRIALRLFQSAEFQMGVLYMIDRTFYPSVFNAQEEGGLGIQSSLTEPKLVSKTDDLEEYYELVSKMDEDEGLRVAINRLESSYRNVSHADSVVDSLIGIEALLSSGPGGGFREVRRRAAVLSQSKSTYSELGRLQNLRNATVHGEETQVDRTDLEEARDLLSTILGRVIELTIERGMPREEILKDLDSAIEKVMHSQFRDLIDGFEKSNQRD